MQIMHIDNLTLIDGLSAAGFLQSVVILVYIVLRVQVFRMAAVAIVYFSFLAVFFALQLALRLEDYADAIRVLAWVAGGMGAPLCYLLVLQVGRVFDAPPLRYLWVLLAMPLAAAAAFVAALPECQSANVISCSRFLELCYWAGSMAGAICMLAVWGHRGLMSGLRLVRGGRERYWLILTLVAVNILAIGINLLRSFGHVDAAEADILTVLLQMSFAYLAVTTLFRVYPAPLSLRPVPHLTFQILSEAEREIAGKIRLLMERDKVYQEPAFSRADLAREVAVSESVLSRVINRAFGKSFPRLVNDYRVEDAKRLLQNPVIPVQTVAFESGFNSLASFNRVFREVTGETPSAWRQWHIESRDHRP
jgi:AraC-like DNA-binding protein